MAKYSPTGRGRSPIRRWSSSRSHSPIRPWSSARAVTRRDEHAGWSASLLGPDLGFAALDVGRDPAVGDAVHALLVHEPVEDPLGGVALFARGVQISTQNRVDQVLVGVDHRRPR